MGFRRFSVLLIVRLIIVGIAASATIWLFLQPGLHSLTFLSAVLLTALAGELWWYVSRTNREVTRFLDAARYADYSQRFNFEKVGAGFDELARTFSEILENFSYAKSPGAPVVGTPGLILVISHHTSWQSIP